MNLPDPTPTPPGIPAEHIDTEEHHKLTDFTENNDD